MKLLSAKEARAKRVAVIHKNICSLRAAGMTNAEMVAHLNQYGPPTRTGAEWTRANIAYEIHRLNKSLQENA